MSVLVDLEEQIKNCYKCADLCVSRRQAVLGDGREGAEIFIVGLAPGRNGADITGVPFTRDKTGELLRRMIRMINLSSGSVYVTNIVKCNPKDKEGRNRNPTQEEIENCSWYLKKEIELINPKLIVPLGVQATEIVIRRKIRSMRHYNSRAIKSEGKVIFPLYHPGFVIRGAYSRSNYAQDFKKLKHILWVRGGILRRLISILRRFF